MNKNFLRVWNILNQWSTFHNTDHFLGKMITGGLFLNYYWGARVLMFPGSNPGADTTCCLGLLLVLSFALRVFFWVTGFSPRLKGNLHSYYRISLNRNYVDKQICSKFVLTEVFISGKVNFKIAKFSLSNFAGAAILNNCDVLRLFYCSDTKSFCLITIGQP